MKTFLKILFLWYGIVSCQCALSQSSAHWQLHDRLFMFDYDDKPLYDGSIISEPQGLNFSTISDVQGNLLFSFHDDSLFYNNRIPVKNGTDIYIFDGRNYNDTFHVFSNSVSYFVKINNHTYYYITHAYHFDLKTAGLIYTVIEKNSHNEWEVTSKNNIVKLGQTGFLNINRNPDGSFGLVNRLGDYIYYYKISSGNFTIKDSLFINTTQGYNDILSTLYKGRIYNARISLDMVMNSFGNSGYFYDWVQINEKDSFLLTNCIKYTFLKLYRFDIDKTNDKFKLLTLMDSLRLEHIDSQIMDIPFNYELSIFPNDSLLVLPLMVFNNISCNNGSYVQDKSSFLLYDIYSGSKTLIRPPTPYARAKVMPSGNMLWFEMYYNKQIQDTLVNFYFSIFTPEDLKNKTENVAVDSFYFPTTSTFGHPARGPGINPYSVSHHLFDYLHFEPEITYSCSANVKLKNLTNKSNGINDFRFYVCKDSACNQIDSFHTFEPIVTFPKSGKYPYKVYGYSPSQTGYGEWYEDTIVVNIPERPMAGFVSSDSVVCRYKEVEFTNKSFTKDTGKLIGINSHWYFANEKDSVVIGDNQDIKYAFTQTGNREVKLIYSNGYCTDTFTRNIEVIDAPTPGFSVNNLIGCTPFDLIINDTHTRFVKQKEYYNSFKNSWDTIPLNQFTISYHFPNTGNYYIIQKLVGANGCVIIKDTAKITIRPGITNQDSTQIFYASYLDNENIELLWNANPAAKNYHLFSSKDGNSYTNTLETNDTFYTHHIPIPQTIYYTAKAFDSCGTSTITSNYAKPILLETKLFGQNEKGILDFTAYEKWQQNIRNYNVYVMDSLGNTQQVYITNSTNFEDKNITDYDLSRICYQVSTPHPTLNKEIKSNTSCINVLPTIYIPNSFTPNNDGLNDQFYPSILGIEYYDLYIYNRWGQLVGNFNKDKYWNGKNAAEGVYIYYIRARTSTGKIINGKGNITLLR